MESRTVRRDQTDWVTIDVLGEEVARLTWMTSGVDVGCWLVPREWAETRNVADLLATPRGSLLRPAFDEARWQVSFERLRYAWAVGGDPLAQRWPEPADHRLLASPRELVELDGGELRRDDLVFESGRTGDLVDADLRPIRRALPIGPLGGVTARHFDLVAAAARLSRHPWVVRLDVVAAGTVTDDAPAAFDLDVLVPADRWQALLDWSAREQRPFGEPEQSRPWVTPNLADPLVRAVATEAGGPYGRHCPALGVDPLRLADVRHRRPARRSRPLALPTGAR